MEKDDKLEELENNANEIQAFFEEKMAIKEDEMEELNKENQLYTLQLNDQISGLEKILQDQKVSG